MAADRTTMGGLGFSCERELMNFDLLAAAPSSISTGLLVVFASDRSSGKDKAAKPEMSLLSSDDLVRKAAAQVLASGEFTAKPNETLLLHAPTGLKAERMLIIGIGKSATATVHDLRKAAGTAARFAKPRGIRAFCVVAPLGFAPEMTARAISEGVIIGDFESDTYRTDRTNQSIESVSVVVPESDLSAAASGLREGAVIGESQNFARALVNEPANRMTPAILAQRAAEMCEEVGLRCDVYGIQKLRELKMGAFLGVAQGSDEPPALIVMTYEPSDAPAEPVLGLVGKGITFDSGGLSLKPADSMEKMKYDMAGGAAMIGAMRAIALLKPKVRVISVICAAENMPSGKAQKPGDVQFSMTGKSIEVLNTDAEGRLVLADGLAYAKQLGATHLIDAATLTGAVMVALGGVNAGAFCNNEDAWQHFEAALRESGEKFWRLPLDEEYRDMLRSPIADIKNVGGRYGGASIAAAFLKEFVGDTPWVHLDIAGTAWLEE